MGWDFELNLDGRIEKKFMQVNFFWHTGSFAHKIFPVVQVRFSVRFPVFVLLMLILEKFQFIHKNLPLVRGPVFCPVSGFCTSGGRIKKKHAGIFLLA